MLKRILCLLSTLLVLTSLAVMNVSAANSDTDNKIYFRVPAEVVDSVSVYCYIREYGAQEGLKPWQSQDTLCLKERTGDYSYDLDKVGGLKKDTYYCVTMSLTNGSQTVEMLLSDACIGDTLAAQVREDVAPSDSQTYVMDAQWENHSPDVFGPVKSISSTGEVEGSCLPADVTPYELFEDFMMNDFEETAKNSQKTDQELIDDVASALGLNSDNVQECIAENKIEADWNKEDSKVPSSGEIASADSKDSVSTGQERTIVYISVAMMCISAGVIFFARRNRLAQLVTV